MNDNYFLSLPMWSVRLGIHIYFASYIMYTHVRHAYGYKGYIHSVHARDFKTVFKILVFKQVMRNGIVDSSKML